MDSSKINNNFTLHNIEDKKQNIDSLQVDKNKRNEFVDTLKDKIEKNKNNPFYFDSQEKTLLRFSNHAVDRMISRGIHFDQNQLSRLQNAVNKAAGKGSKNALVLLDDSAMIVSIKNNTIVTVMDKEAMKENIFTNIDSTVVI